MTDRPDLAALRALAEAATPGPWETYMDSAVVAADGVTAEDKVDTSGTYFSADLFGPRHRADAAYIAACSPDRILTLIARLDEALSVLQSVAAHLDGSSSTKVASAIHTIEQELDRQLPGLREGTMPTSPRTPLEELTDLATSHGLDVSIAWQGHAPAVQALYEHLEVMRQEHDLNFAQMSRLLDFAYRIEAEAAQQAAPLDVPTLALVAALAGTYRTEEWWQGVAAEYARLAEKKP